MISPCNNDIIMQGVATNEFYYLHVPRYWLISYSCSMHTIWSTAGNGRTTVPHSMRELS